MSTPAIRIQKVTRTGLGALFQTSRYTGSAMPNLPNATLNQRFNIFPDEVFLPNDSPRIGYLLIGYGGHVSRVGANNVSYWERQPALARFTSLYKPRPFVLRTLDNDLTLEQRANYRLRRLETHNGVVYVAYYARVLDFSQSTLELSYVAVDGDNLTITPFEPTLADLNPTPPVLANVGQTVTTGDYLMTTQKVVFSFSESDLADYLQVAAILDGTENLAIITEGALCFGVDRQVQGNFGGTQTYTEVIRAQIATFFNTKYSAAVDSQLFTITFDFGNNEPLLVTTQISATP